ncbi:MAG TPA: class II fructose-bisphosphate aldolase [Armatimonadota bacterium]
MSYLPLAELLTHARQHGYAVPSFCAWNAEALETVLRVAARLNAPVIVMAGPGEFSLLRPRILAPIARQLLEEYPVTAALHLDHGDSLELVDDCLTAGFSGVMLDYSAKPYAENVAALQKAVRRSRPYGASVEAEIGHVGRIDNISIEGERASTLTEPSDAVAFVEATGVDALAISIGNAHGQYTQLPQFDFPRLAAIQQATKIPLVLHGGSGTPDAELRQAIELGITKVNVATDLVAAVRSSLLAQWQAGRNLWTPAAQAEAALAMEPAIERWITRTGAKGKA